MKDPVQVAQVQSLSDYLLAQHGPTIGYQELAEILGVSPGALRLRKTRRDDLPEPVSGLNANRWATPTIAVWLLSAGVPASFTSESRRGRPRNQLRRGG